MGDYRYQHGMDVESSSSYMQTPPPRYVLLSENGDPNLRPPPNRRNIPRYNSKPAKSGGSCCICICCCCCLLFFLIFALAGSLLFFYFYFNPKPPSYSVQNMSVTKFQMDPDLSLYTEFVVTVRAENPNEKISITYDKGSLITVSYSDSTLCSGKLPTFNQGYKNTTMMKVVLKGKSEFGSGFQAALMEQKNTGRIPLEIMVEVPVVVALGDMKLRRVTVIVLCSLVVDSLDPNKKIGIKSSKYKVDAKF